MATRDAITKVELLLKEFEDTVADTQDEDFRLRRKKELAAFLAERGFVPSTQDTSAGRGDNNDT